MDLGLLKNANNKKEIFPLQLPFKGGGVCVCVGGGGGGGGGGGQQAAALPRSESSLEVSEELPEWVQNCMPLVSWVFHLNYHCPTSTYCKSVSILLLCSLPDILPTSVYLPADQNPHYTPWTRSRICVINKPRPHRKYCKNS